jgi:DNA recombination protein RmuC
MEIVLAVVIALLAVAIVALIVTRARPSHVDTKPFDERLDSLNQRLGEVTGQASQYQETINAVHQSLGGLTQSAQQILRVGQDVRQLQDVLSAPKLRGGLGELLLEDLLCQVLPHDVYEMQHTFQNGHRVDAVIRLTNGIVPIDAKFPLESFRRLLENVDDQQVARRQFRADIRRHVDAIAQSYILPGETLDFALMYLPSESVYYEVLVEDRSQESILDYAWTKRVIPTSPNSFYAYLQVIALGFRGLQIEQNARTMLDSLTRLRDDFGRFADDYRLVGTHLNRAQAKYSEALPKLESLQRALPGQVNMAAPIEEPALPDPSETEALRAPWEYSPPQPRRGRPPKAAN